MLVNCISYFRFRCNLNKLHLKIILLSHPEPTAPDRRKYVSELISFFTSQNIVSLELVNEFRPNQQSSFPISQAIVKLSRCIERFSLETLRSQFLQGKPFHGNKRSPSSLSHFRLVDVTRGCPYGSVCLRNPSASALATLCNSCLIPTFHQTAACKARDLPGEG